MTQAKPETKKPSELRQKMPTVAAWLDDLRAEFGAERINQQIIREKRGEPTFWATENGYQAGTKSRDQGVKPVIWNKQDAEKKTANHKTRR